LRLEEREREVTDLKYQTEKDDFQLKLKEETLSQTRDQLKRAEQLFKEEVERLRKDFFEQLTKDYDNQKTGGQQRTDENLTRGLKTAIQ